MSVTTVVIIIVVVLLLYYCGMIGYDLYLGNLAQANRDEDKESAIDISGQVKDFQSIPVNNPRNEESILKKFKNLLMMGMSAAKLNRLATSAAEGTPAQELEGMLFAIRNYPTEE